MKRTFLAAAAIAASAVGAQAAQVVDVIDYTYNAANGWYFVPPGGNELTRPYYRDSDEDWGWTHNAIAAGFTSASLSISAFDVDEAPCERNLCEVDTVSAWDADTSTWVELGNLTGDDDTFSYTEFDIYAAAGGALIDDISDGLQIALDISTIDTFWLVSIAKSVITTDGAVAPDPDPDPVVPLPAAGWALLTALGGFAVAGRRKG
ncbi:hypothetical protein RGUI_0614 [Rhodovulum sp. P5]|uniref:VPLPA-CTERM sorting domain-containing protein n=1 Tax=Rhodovulum sp. P5 TaxID=1564506 RepID=UPI0009C1F571|nr:VPLPA-CTERM sorting domain-containing protein [Rhodovulum sp. P5]ARE38755.1 hypothetical protein RGUI_0614 [Rhodovulum sp. P5]